MEAKVFKLLRSLSKKEWKDFGLYLKSPISKSPKNCHKLYLHLQKHFPEFNPDKLKESEIDIQIFGKGKTTGVNYRSLLSDLNALCENFLLIQQVNAGQNWVKLALCKELLKRNLSEHFYSKLSEQRKLLDKNNITTESLLFQYLYTEIWLVNEQKNTLGKMHHLNRKINVESILKDLTEYYQAQLLLNYHSVNEHNRIHNLGLNTNIYKNIIQTINTSNESQNPLVLILKSTENFLSNKSPENAWVLSETMKKHSSRIGSEILQSVNTHLGNYYAGEVSKGAINMLEPAYNCYRYALKNNFAFIDEIIPDSFFINYIQIAVLNQKLNDAEGFFKNYSQYLKKDNKNSTVAYCSALINYEFGRITDALKNLQSANFDTPVRQLGIKNLYLKIYFDRNDYDSALSMMDSYRHVIKKMERLSDEVRNTHTNFLRFYQKLWQQRSKFSSSESLMLFDEIKKCTQVSNKSWLLRQF